MSSTTARKKILDVTLRHVKIDGIEKGKVAVSVEGSGSTTIKLEGDNELVGGYEHAALEKNDDRNAGKQGSLTITADVRLLAS